MPTRSRVVVRQPRRPAAPDVHKHTAQADVSYVPPLHRRIKSQNQRQPYDLSHRHEIYRRTPVAGEAEYGLCADCASINFEAIYNIDPSSIDTGTHLYWTLPVTDLDHVQGQTISSCSLCRFFSHTVKSFEESRESIYRGRGSWKLFIVRAEDYSGTPDDAVMLCMSDGQLGKKNVPYKGVVAGRSLLTAALICL